MVVAKDEDDDKQMSQKKNKAMPPALNIVGYDDREQGHPSGIDLPDWMPKHEFFMLIVAPAGCGKTTLILNLVLRIYRNYFNRIIVFSPTIHNDQKWKHLIKAKHVLRRNPHHRLLQTESQTDTLDEEGGSTHGSQTSNATNAHVLPQSGLDSGSQPLWECTPDTIPVETFGKAGGHHSIGHKKMGTNYLKAWKQYKNKSKLRQHQVMATPEQLTQEALRRQNLAHAIVKPITPVMATSLNHYNRMLGIQTPDGGWLYQADPAMKKWSYVFGLYPEAYQTFQTSPFHRGAAQLQAAQDEQEQQRQTQQQQVSQASSQKKYHQVPKSDLHEEYSEDTLQEIMDQQDKMIAKLTSKKIDMTKADHILWVFDDMVGSGLFNQKRNNAFKRLSVRRRHFCSSVVGVVQAYKEFPRTSRTNANIFILFRIDNEDELESIYSDFPCGLDWEQWRLVYDYCTKDPYHFMMINTQAKDSRYRITKNFIEPLCIPFDKEEKQAWFQHKFSLASRKASRNASSTSSSPSSTLFTGASLPEKEAENAFFNSAKGMARQGGSASTI